MSPACRHECQQGRSTCTNADCWDTPIFAPDQCEGWAEYAADFGKALALVATASLLAWFLS